MRILVLAAFAATAGLIAAAYPGRARADAGPRISGPFTHENLSIYFIHGEGAQGPIPLTLQEALDRGTVHVLETGAVNELKIENLGNEDVFIQSGDIVKGGRQDRVLTVSFVLPRNSGQLPISSFCVEHGRWSARGLEDAAKFGSSSNSLPSREAKLAMKAPAEPAQAASKPAGREAYNSNDTSRRQVAVWNEVAKTQEKLSAGLNAAVASPLSATSLELSLENETLKTLRAEYVRALEGKAEADDIVGFAFTINGRINSADIYPSSGLFRKMWAKLLTASVTEAVSEKTGSAGVDVPTISAVRDFLANAEKGKSHAQEVGGLVRQDIRDGDRALFVEASRAGGEWVHRNYLAK